MCAVRRLGALCARTEQSGPLDPRAAVNVDRDPIAATELSAVAKEPGRMLPDLKTTTWRRSRGSEASLALARSSGNGFAAVLVELIESMLMDHAEQYIEIVGTRKGLGVRLSMDHFGTGSSSRTLLSRCPVDELKID